MGVADKLADLRRRIAQAGNLAVAFSGGVDSTLLLFVAHDVLGSHAVAFSAVSAAFPAREQAEARAFCAERGIEQVVVATHETEAPGYRANPPDRCYLCKRALFAALRAAARTRGFEVLADGTNLDDADDWRPGIRALGELDVTSPLRDAGLTKAEIRELSRELGLPTWDKPSCACLASRFPYGEPITDEGLARVDAAENWLADKGFEQVRVRVHGRVARIEVAEDAVAALACGPLRREADQALRELGFAYVALDLRGYRSGSLNEVL